MKTQFQNAPRETQKAFMVSAFLRCRLVMDEYRMQPINQEMKRILGMRLGEVLGRLSDEYQLEFDVEKYTILVHDGSELTLSFDASLGVDPKIFQ